MNLKCKRDNIRKGMRVPKEVQGPKSGKEESNQRRARGKKRTIEK